jgi:transcriptional regulator with XRE-family HTH domain
MIGDLKLTENIGQLLKDKRQELRMSQNELSEYIGIPSATIASIESGNSKQPKLETLEKISKALKITFKSSAFAFNSNIEHLDNKWHLPEEDPFPNGEEIILLINNSDGKPYISLDFWSETKKEFEFYENPHNVLAWHPTPKIPEIRKVLIQ